MGQAQALALQRFGLAREGTGVMTELTEDPFQGGASGAVTPPSHEQEWETLIHRIAHGDQQALGTFYDTTSSLVYGLALRIVGNAAAAEDVTLDVYMQVWRQAAVYNAQRGTPTAWLFMLTRSRAIDLLRSQMQEQKHTAALAGAETFTSAVTPEESTVVTERRRLVRTAFAALAPEQREVLDLAYFSGLSHGDIAARLSLPLGTVKTRIRLGIARLRELLHPLLE
jgi:RNA polymerase sigma-70 factor (ECF subfamily)